MANDYDGMTFVHLRKYSNKAQKLLNTVRRYSMISGKVTATKSSKLLVPFSLLTFKCQFTVMNICRCETVPHTLYSDSVYSAVFSTICNAKLLKNSRIRTVTRIRTVIRTVM